ncbi:cobyric acid synthase [Clostridium sp. KNHs216]|uniref:cobyric acid synthase n=1 Tax=Clostridium sp. KNHs216 TaxID=1550235 RepID=UPI0011506C5E|nr:cobyric acid synthase [Clostridium sp. KNHs216]TQI68124.1 adenosylcobyric acid synthase (glutamine-hydrolysing) [Clostridium sp. KNHs216]
MAKVLMIQGTMSNAGKSLLTAGLCRILKQDGYRVAPFKSQNMALNSYITDEGLEMGRAQVMQAEAAGIKPSVLMNPILLKPTNDTGSQVIVNGEVIGNMSAKEYFAYKTKLIPNIKRAFHELEKQADIILVEGAGSPAEINLKENDIVNMGLAEMLDAPVLLVGDIDRGGVFAQLLGTLMLLEDHEKARVKGLIINKFRGDPSILDPGIRMLEEKSGVPVAGVVPYMEISVEDEDSLTGRFDKREEAQIDIAVIRFPRISNFTDFSVFERIEGVSVRYVDSAAQLHRPDMILLPGSKNTMGDLKWMRQNGLEAAVKKRKGESVIFGICGGYQMLGRTVSDPYEVEEGGAVRGMELLPMETELETQKVRTRVEGAFGQVPGIFSGLSGRKIKGYEIHMGVSSAEPGCLPLCSLTNVLDGGEKKDGISGEDIYGTYVHGIFDEGEIASVVVRALAHRKGLSMESGLTMDYGAFKESQYDKLANTLRKHLDLHGIYRILNGGTYDKRSIG